MYCTYGLYALHIYICTCPIFRGACVFEYFGIFNKVPALIGWPSLTTDVSDHFY